MSREVEQSDLTAGGDATPVEAIKIDNCTDTVAIIAAKNTDVMPEDATAFAGEVAKEVLNAQAEDERSIGATSDANIPVGQEVANSETHTAEITNIATEIIDAEDVIQAEAQENSSAEEANKKTIVLQCEETSKPANEEKV